MARNPAVAGSFYPANPTELREMLKALFSGAKKGSSLGVVSPHAGYPYSGKGSAAAVNSLKKAKSFIVMGPSHTGIGAQFAVMAGGGWETPLGRVKIDSRLAGELMKSCDFLKDDETAHMQEHSIEVQLPFLQHRFGKFQFVPICIMNMDYSKDFLDKCIDLGKVIAKIVKGKSIGIVASSDFSHQVPLEFAKSVDAEAVDMIIKKDMQGFFRVLSENNASVCGFGPIAVLMAFAKELDLKGKLLHSSNSGDVLGEYTAVVNYQAIGFG